MLMEIWTTLILCVVMWIQRTMLTIDCSLQRLSQMIRLADLVHPPERPPGLTQPSLWDPLPGKTGQQWRNSFLQ